MSLLYLTLGYHLAFDFEVVGITSKVSPFLKEKGVKSTCKFGVRWYYF